MPEQYRPPRREVEPDPLTKLLMRFVNKLMRGGKKSVTLLSPDTFDIIEQRTRLTA